MNKNFLKYGIFFIVLMCLNYSVFGYNVVLNSDFENGTFDNWNHNWSLAGGIFITNSTGLINGLYSLAIYDELGQFVWYSPILDNTDLNCSYFNNKYPDTVYTICHFKNNYVLNTFTYTGAIHNSSFYCGITIYNSTDGIINNTVNNFTYSNDYKSKMKSFMFKCYVYGTQDPAGITYRDDVKLDIIQYNESVNNCSDSLSSFNENYKGIVYKSKEDNKITHAFSIRKLSDDYIYGISGTYIFNDNLINLNVFSKNNSDNLSVFINRYNENLTIYTETGYDLMSFISFALTGTETRYMRTEFIQGNYLDSDLAYERITKIYNNSSSNSCLLFEVVEDYNFSICEDDNFFNDFFGKKSYKWCLSFGEFSNNRVFNLSPDIKTLSYDNTTNITTINSTNDYIEGINKENGTTILEDNNTKNKTIINNFNCYLVGDKWFCGEQVDIDNLNKSSVYNMDRTVKGYDDTGRVVTIDNIKGAIWYDNLSGLWKFNNSYDNQTYNFTGDVSAGLGASNKIGIDYKLDAPRVPDSSLNTTSGIGFLILLLLLILVGFYFLTKLKGNSISLGTGRGRGRGRLR